MGGVLGLLWGVMLVFRAAEGRQEGDVGGLLGRSGSEVGSWVRGRRQLTSDVSEVPVGSAGCSGFVLAHGSRQAELGLVMPGLGGLKLVLPCFPAAAAAAAAAAATAATATTGLKGGEGFRGHVEPLPDGGDPGLPVLGLGRRRRGGRRRLLKEYAVGLWFWVWLGEDAFASNGVRFFFVASLGARGSGQVRRGDHRGP